VGYENVVIRTWAMKASFDPQCRKRQQYSKNFRYIGNERERTNAKQMNAMKAMKGSGSENASKRRRRKKEEVRI
jgi:hypothetical protein